MAQKAIVAYSFGGSPVHGPGPANRKLAIVVALRLAIGKGAILVVQDYLEASPTHFCTGESVKNYSRQKDSASRLLLRERCLLTPSARAGGRVAGEICSSTLCFSSPPAGRAAEDKVLNRPIEEISASRVRFP